MMTSKQNSVIAMASLALLMTMGANWLYVKSSINYYSSEQYRF